MGFQFNTGRDNREFLNTLPEQKIAVPGMEQFSSLEVLHCKYVEAGLCIVCWNLKQHSLPHPMSPPIDL